jgi:hypothetical protein
MIFNTNTAFNIGKKDVKFLDAGIHENVSFERIRHEKSTNGNLFLEFTFSKDGATMTHTEYEPNRFPDQTEEAFNEKINTQVARILQILEAFYDRSQLSFQADSFTSFASWVATLMNSVDKTKKVRLKVVYGSSGFTTLPRYAVYTFIEPMTVTEANSKIKKLGIDTFTRPENGDKEAEAPKASSTFSIPEQTSAPF